MRLYPVLLAASLIGFSLVFFAAPAAACSCARATDAATALAAAHTVFEGRVVQANPENAQAAQPAPALLESADLRPGLELRPPQMLYRFEVLRSWKGNPAKLITIETASQSATCGRSYVSDQSYLIYAYQGSEGRLADNSCTRSALSSEAGEDIAALTALSAVPSPSEPLAPTKTQAPEPAKDPAEISPSCTLSGTKRTLDFRCLSLFLLVVGSILNRRQRP